MNKLYPAFLISNTFNTLSNAVILLARLSLVASLLAATSSLSADETKSGKGEFIGAMETVYPDWFKVSFMELEEDVAEAAEQGKRLMLMFHQNGCPYCNAFVERNLAQSDIEQTLKTKFDVIEFNMWGDREVVSIGGETYSEKEFAKALEVQFTPTTVFLTETGELSLRLNGYYDPDQFRHALEYVTNKLESKLSFNDFLESKKQSKSSDSLVTRSYFTGPVNELASRPGKNDKPLIIMFEQGSCKNCETLHEDILAKQESKALLAEFDIYQIDMWGQESFKSPTGIDTTGRQLSQQLDIKYAPTMVLYAPDGTEVIRSESFFKTFHTQSIMDYVVSDAWREQPSFQRYLSERADVLREEGHDVNIWD